MHYNTCECCAVKGDDQSNLHHASFGFWAPRLYLKHLFSVSFEVVLSMTVKKDIVSFDSNMQYYSKFVA